jgi:hypothetical protein
VFRRRRQTEPAGPEPAGQPGPGEGPAAAAGPWDATGDVPEAERLDLGSLRVPVHDDMEIQISMAEDQAAWVTVVRGDSGLQLQAFAAPKSDGLWDEVRQEIAEEVTKAGGKTEETSGPFGAELRAWVASPVAGPAQPARFLGVDGPRWFLRGVITGPAARREDLAKPLERVFAGVVVVRGDHPVPPRDLLEIQLPEEARQAMGEQEPQAEAWPRSPFERGPEITETR